MTVASVDAPWRVLVDGVAALLRPSSSWIWLIGRGSVVVAVIVFCVVLRRRPCCTPSNHAPFSHHCCHHSHVVMVDHRLMLMSKVIWHSTVDVSGLNNQRRDKTISPLKGPGRRNLRCRCCSCSYYCLPRYQRCLHWAGDV